MTHHTLDLISLDKTDEFTTVEFRRPIGVGDFEHPCLGTHSLMWAFSYDEFRSYHARKGTSNVEFVQENAPPVNTDKSGCKNDAKIVGYSPGREIGWEVSVSG